MDESIYNYANYSRKNVIQKKQMYRLLTIKAKKKCIYNFKCNDSDESDIKVYYWQSIAQRQKNEIKKKKRYFTKNCEIRWVKTIIKKCYTINMIFLKNNVVKL